MVGSSSSLFWLQSRHRPAISSCREEGVVVPEERVDLVEGGSANLKQQAVQEGTVVWVGMMTCLVLDATAGGEEGERAVA
jgi:hypothetical protein